MFSTDDILDVCLDALTREPDAPVLTPLFKVTVNPKDERWSTKVLGKDRDSDLMGVRQVVEIEGAGRYSIQIEECG